MKRFHKTYLLTLLGAVLTSLLSAQDVRVSISSKEGYVGLPLDYTITITDTKKADVPQLEGFDGFDIDFKGQTQSTQSFNINGQRSTSITVMFSWELTPLREGTLTIPSIPVKLENQVYQTPEGRISVVPPREVEGYRLVLEAEQDKVIVGQPVTVNMDFYVSSEVGNLKFTLPGGKQGSGEGVDFTILDSEIPDQNSHNIRQIPVGNRVFYGYVGSRMEGGAQYTVLTVPLEIVPLRAGELVLDNAAVAFTAQRGSWPRTVSEDHVIPSRECRLTVGKLPAEIENSANGILLARGELKADVTVSSQEARPGDPLTLRIVLSPLDHPELCEIPPLAEFTGIESNFSLPKDRSRPKAEGNSLVITQTIRPVSVAVREIPSLDFVYYDLEEERVKHLQTEPIPLVMSSAGDLSMTDVESFQSSSGGTSELRENDRGIRQNKSLDRLSAGDRRGTSYMASVPYRLMFFAPPFLFCLYLLILLVLHIFKRSREKANSNSLRQLKKSLAAGEDPLIAYERYIRQRLFGGRSFKRSGLKEKGASLGLEELENVYLRLEQSRFGGGTAAVGMEEILETAENLEKKL